MTIISGFYLEEIFGGGGDILWGEAYGECKARAIG